MQESESTKLVDVNKLLTCTLCNGYYIDATTIIECLHSFCRTCIVRYIQSNKSCPTCQVQIHKTRPLLNIKPDQTLQDIVYKVVPNLYKNEMKRRQNFYAQKSDLVHGSIPLSSEKRADIYDCHSLIFSPEDIISVTLEYSPLIEDLPVNLQSEALSSEKENFYKTHRRYLSCPGALKVHHLKKFLRAKYGVLCSSKRVDIMYMHDFLREQYTLIDLAYIYSWKRSEPLRLFYKIAQESDGTESPLKHSTEISEALSTPICIPPLASTCNTPSIVSPIVDPLSPPPSPKMAEDISSSSEQPGSAALPNSQASVKNMAVPLESQLSSKDSSVPKPVELGSQLCAKDLLPQSPLRNQPPSKDSFPPSFTSFAKTHLKDLVQPSSYTLPKKCEMPSKASLINVPETKSAAMKEQLNYSLSVKTEPSCEKTGFLNTLEKFKSLTPMSCTESLTRSHDFCGRNNPLKKNCDSCIGCKTKTSAVVSKNMLRRLMDRKKAKKDKLKRSEELSRKKIVGSLGQYEVSPSKVSVKQGDGIQILKDNSKDGDYEAESGVPVTAMDITILDQSMKRVLKKLSRRRRKLRLPFSSPQKRKHDKKKKETENEQIQISLSEGSLITLNSRSYLKSALKKTSKYDPFSSDNIFQVKKRVSFCLDVKDSSRDENELSSNTLSNCS